MRDELEKFVFFLQAIFSLWFKCYELFFMEIIFKMKAIDTWSSSIVFQMNHIVCKMWTDFFWFTFEFVFEKEGKGKWLKEANGFLGSW